VNVDFRLALLKNFDFEVDITDRDYKKFRSDTRIIPLGESARPTMRSAAKRRKLGPANGKIVALA
jgi:hypothetical protein